MLLEVGQGNFVDDCAGDVDGDGQVEMAIHDEAVNYVKEGAEVAYVLVEPPEEGTWDVSDIYLAMLYDPAEEYPGGVTYPILGTDFDGDGHDDVLYRASLDPAWDDEVFEGDRDHLVRFAGGPTGL